MNIQQLRYVFEVARHGLNVSEAAEALFTSQPGVSKQIRLLEEELGVEIFVRHGKRLVAVTEPGRQVLAIAERLDTLAGGFAAGLKPTGNKDPFALRRNALGLARSIIESGFDLDLPALLASANAGLAERKVQADAGELYDFIIDRLKGYYADKGVPATHFNAVVELKPASLYDFDRRIDAIGTFAQLPEAEALLAEELP